MLSDLTRDSVMTAVAEFDRLGRDRFLEEHGYGRARSYFLDLDDRLYDSKAIAGVAHGYARPDMGLLKAKDFSGGEATVKAALEALGFTVIVVGEEPDWDLEPGQEIDRRSLHARYGGSTQSGICPSASTPNILIFTNPSKGPEHGYYDRWMEDGAFHYTGEGQKGDQTFIRGNKALRDHTADARAVRLFEATSSSGIHRYLGEFEVDPADPYHWDRAPETGGGPIRDVIVFHLLPAGTVDHSMALELPIVETKEVSVSDIEAHNTEAYLSRPHTETIEKERREQALVRWYASHLEAQGFEVRRFIYRVGQTQLACDAFDITNDVLIEAKSTTDRNSIRIAIGQLLDYARFHDPRPRLRVLLPRHPGRDLSELLMDLDIQVAYRTRDGFSLER